MAILASITALLEQDFVPRRTLILAFGYDEESTAYRLGAASLGEVLLDRWGPNSLAIILDEGAIGITKHFGRTVAIPQVGEKGFMDLELTVHLPGGHSSIPPSHTSIGILSEAVTTLEGAADSNFPLVLSPENPIYTYFQCAAEDPRTEISDELRDAIRDPRGAEKVVELIASDPGYRSVLHTTQAVTIFKAGNKANALPAYATALVNYRISASDGLDTLRERLTNTLRPVAEKNGLNYTAGFNAGPHGVPEFTLDLSWSFGLEPSPISSQDSPSYAAFSGVIKHVFDEGEGEDVLVTPYYAGGNTDTRFYWDLSSQIYRFGPLRQWHDKGWGGVHDVNERVSRFAMAC